MNLDPGTDALEDNAAPGSQTVRRAMGILRLVACGQEHGVRLTDLVTMSGLNRPAVHRLLKALVVEGAVEQDPGTRRYRMGPEIALLGLARTRRFPLLALADPYLAELANQVGDTVFLSVRRGTDSICIGRKTGTHPIQVLSIEVGVRRPLGLGVSGIALLSCLDEAECAALMRANARRLSLHRESPALLLERVALARQAGEAHAPIGLMPGTSAIAVPVRGRDGEPLAAITITAMAERLGEARLGWVKAVMHETAARVARRLIEVEHSATHASR